MLDFLSQMEIPYTVVLTKADKLNKTETENSCADHDSDDIANFYAFHKRPPIKK